MILLNFYYLFLIVFILLVFEEVFLFFKGYFVNLIVICILWKSLFFFCYKEQFLGYCVKYRCFVFKIYEKINIISNIIEIVLIRFVVQIEYEI